MRIQAIRFVASRMLLCVFTDRGSVRRVISLPYANRKEREPIVRRTRSEIDRKRLLAELAARPQPSEAEIERQAAEDADGWTDADVAAAIPVYPPPTAAELRDLRARLGLSQAQFARRFGFSVDTVQQYEQGRRVPSGPASTLLRVIAADPDAVVRALDPRRQQRGRGSQAAE